MIEIKFAQLHDTIFLAGKNFPAKLEPKNMAGLQLFYDREEKELLIHWAGEIGIIPFTNIRVMVAGAVEQRTQTMHPIAAGMIQQKISAQVETPQSHVHGGPGKGRR